MNVAAANLKLFVFDEDGSSGPLPVEVIRRGITSEKISAGARFRAVETQPWLPGTAWEALADLLPAPRTPAPPEGPVGTSLPEEISATPVRVREHLLWFVADKDGVMGPVSGDFVVKGMKNDKIPLTATVSLATWTVGTLWARAPLVFPATHTGATTIRQQRVPTRPCGYCLEPVPVGALVCGACGESVRLGAGFGGVARVLVVFGAFAVAATAALGSAALARRFPAGGAAATPMATAREPAPAPAGSGAAGAKGAPLEAAAARGRGHLATGDIAARLEVGRDAANALALSDHRIAIARPGALDVIDDRNGALAFAAADLGEVRTLFPIHAGSGAAYALVGERLAALDARTARVAAWIDVGEATPAGVSIAIDRGIALLADPERQAVTVLDTARHVTLARPVFEASITAVAVADSGRIALAVTGSAGVLYAFAPARGAADGAGDAGATAGPLEAPGRAVAPLRRIDLGHAPAAVAVAGDGAFAAAVLRGRAELVRIDLGPSAALAPPGPRVKTCAEPVAVAIAAEVIVVACQSGRTASLHDGETLAVLASIALGGPAIGLDVAPDRAQALVTLGAPAPGVAVLDLPRREARTIEAGEPITPARYGLGGRIATALAPRSHRLLVLR